MPSFPRLRSWLEQLLHTHDTPHRTAGAYALGVFLAFSPMLGHWIGLGLIAHGPRRIGERVSAADPVRNKTVEVEICAPCFIDPQGERLRA